MNSKINAYLEELKSFNDSNVQKIEELRIKFLSKKGLISALFEEFKSLAPQEKREIGRSLNDLKNFAQSKIEELKSLSANDDDSTDKIDSTKPAAQYFLGSRHPVNLVKNEIVGIFEKTHTSSVQVRVMENEKPPIRTISPGRVFRNEAISSRSHCIFHQIEGLYVDKDVSFADLKQTLLYFAQEFFGKETKIRLRPSYFPFTEPSAEVDVYWGLENEVDYRMTKGTGWLEVMGCGMVDPNVLKNCGIDPEVYSGFAFGMGVERIAMQRYQISDIRLLFENDMRFLEQFHSEL